MVYQPFFCVQGNFNKSIAQIMSKALKRHIPKTFGVLILFRVIHRKLEDLQSNMFLPDLKRVITIQLIVSLADRSFNSAIISDLVY